MEIVKNTLDDILTATFSHLIKNGTVTEGTRGKFKEDFGVLIELTNPRARLSRTETKGKVFSSLGELLWYLSGQNSLEFISHYVPAYRNESEDGVTVFGGYGPRLFDNRGHNQFERICDILKNKPDSKRAVIQIFDAADIAKKRKEVPCTCTLQFVVRDEKLSMMTHMRSNDAFLGLPHDVFAFTMLQEIIARRIGQRLGTYKHSVGSLHLYEKHKQKAQEFLDEGFQWTTNAMLPMPRTDPMMAIKKLLKIERKARCGEEINLSKYKLNKYWADIARLVMIHSCYKRSDTLEANRIAREMEHKIYDVYIQGREKIARREVPEQSSFGFFDHPNKKK